MGSAPTRSGAPQPQAAAMYDKLYGSTRPCSTRPQFHDMPTGVTSFDEKGEGMILR